MVILLAKVIQMHKHTNTYALCVYILWSSYLCDIISWNFGVNNWAEHIGNARNACSTQTNLCTHLLPFSFFFFILPATLSAVFFPFFAIKHPSLMNQPKTAFSRKLIVKNIHKHTYVCVSTAPIHSNSRKNWKQLCVTQPSTRKYSDRWSMNSWDRSTRSATVLFTILSR